MHTNVNLLLDKIKMSGLEIIDTGGFMELLLRFTLNTVILFLLVRWLYYGTTKRKDYLFAFVMIGSVIFLLCYLLENVKLQIGVAFGMFAIFGILRYRTSQIPIKEMTYLFLVIGVSVINALANRKVSIVEIIFADITIVAITYLLERVWLLKNESCKIVRYEKIEWIKTENRDKLIQDLQDRTGINRINRIEIGSIDFLRDTAKILVYYDEESSINIADQESFSKEGNDDDVD